MRKGGSLLVRAHVPLETVPHVLSSRVRAKQPRVLVQPVWWVDDRLCELVGEIRITQEREDAPRITGSN